MINTLSRKNFWTKLDILLKGLVIIGVFSLIFVLSHTAMYDLDIWLHLKTGEFIVQNKTIPSSDIFSFTVQGRPWVDHEWLFQLVTYFIYSRWQADGLIFLQSLVIILSFLVLFLIGYKTTNSYMKTAVFIVITAYASMGRFNIRPDIFSLFFFTLYLYLLRFHIDKRGIWLLIPIQVLWVNFHGYFFLGPLIILLFIIAEFLRRKIKFLPWQWKEGFVLSDTTYNRLKKIFFFIVLANLLNPRGLEGALYPVYVFKDVLLGKTQIFFEHIQELQPTFIRGKYLVSNFNFYYMIIVFCFLLMAINFKRLKIIDILIVLFFFLFALKIRNMAFFSFIGYMVGISYLGQTPGKISRNVNVQAPFKEAFYLLFEYVLAVTLIVWSALKINGVLGEGYYDFDSKEFKSTLFGINHKHYPEKAVDFILENEISSNMFNDFNSGAYLIGRAYPKRKVFIDGRTELYSPEFFSRYIDLVDGDISIFESIIDRFRIGAILLTTPIPKIITYIYKSPKWKLTFLDDSAVVFLKDIPSNQELIKRYKIDFNKYLVPTADLKNLGLRRIYPTPYIKRASLFNLLKEDTPVIAECKEALRIMPNCATGHHLLGKVYLRKGLYQEAFENLRSAAVLFPGNVEILLDLGNCLKELKEAKAAINTLKGAIRFNRRYAPAYYELGCVYLHMDNKLRAIQALNKALKLAKRDKELRKKIEDKLKEIEDKK